MKVLDEMIQKNTRGLNSPMDRMLGMESFCNYFKIEDEAGICGYFSTNNKNVILEFYIKDINRKDIYKILEFIIKENEIKDMLEYTNDPEYYLMFKKIFSNIISFDKINMNYPTINEIYEILGYFKNIGMTEKWLEDYIIQRINQNEIMLFRYNDIIIGTGELKSSMDIEKHAMGVTVSNDLKGKGVYDFIESYINKIN